MITQERLKKLFDYRKDGALIRKKSGGGSNVGDVAGTLNLAGYVAINACGKIHLAHRLVWMYHNGYLPENPIDHINRERSDNRIENLREVSMQCNLRNVGNFSHNTSGVKGVSYTKRKGRNPKWRAYIAVNRKYLCLGYHDEYEEAVFARLAGEQCLDWNGCDSNSPAFVYCKKILNNIK